MLLEELSRNKKAGLIILALCVIYISSKNFLFRTILGRLFLVVGLVATTKCNKVFGLGLVLLICLAYLQMSNDFENMDTMEPTSNSTSAPNASSAIKTKSTSKTSSTPTKDSESTTISNLKTTPPDMATIAKNMRDIIKGTDSSSLPITPKSSSKDALGVPDKIESFLNYAPFNH